MNYKGSPKSYLWYGVCLLAADVLLVWLLDRMYAVRSGISVMQGLPLAFSLLHVVTIGILGAVMIYRKWTQENFDARARKLAPELQKRFAEHASGLDESAELKVLLRQDALIVEHALTEFLTTVKGNAKDRLSELAVEFGFVSKWDRDCTSRNAEHRRQGVVALSLMPLSISKISLRKALHDRDPELQVLAARALVQSSDRDELQEIFIFSLDQSLRVRACLTEDFRKHAIVLCETAVPKVLATDDRKRILIMFEMLGAWRRSIHLEGWRQMFEVSTGSNRAIVLRLLPYVSYSDEAEPYVLGALSDENQEVLVTAAHIAGHWELIKAVPALSKLLSDVRPDVDRAAAQALSKLGAAGQQVLEQAVLGHLRRAGGAALEALEYFNTGRLSRTAI